MTIIDEIKQAHRSYIQGEWDKWLLNDWKRSTPYAMAWSSENFIRKYKISYDEFHSLKRVPRNRFQLRSLVTRFVAGYLPSLSNLLWDGKGTDEQILAYMKTLDTLKTPIDVAKSRKERSERTKAIREAHAENKAHALVREQRERTAKSNWNHCK